MIDDIISRYWKHLKAFHGVLSIKRGTEFVNGKNTGVPCITVFVTKKKLLTQLKPEQVLPTEIEGTHIDVIELSSNDYQLGETSVSNLPPEQQKRMASGVKK